MKGISLRKVKKKRQILFIILCAIALSVVLTIVFFCIYNSLQSKIDTDTGIQENIYIKIGGIEQYLQIRGENRNKPFAKHAKALVIRLYVCVIFTKKIFWRNNI